MEKSSRREGDGSGKACWTKLDAAKDLGSCLGKVRGYSAGKEEGVPVVPGGRCRFPPSKEGMEG